MELIFPLHLVLLPRPNIVSEIRTASFTKYIIYDLRSFVKPWSD